MVTKVVNLRKEKYDVYVGRGSKWGNIFVIGRDGDREEVIRKYREWILENDYLLSCLSELKDKVLGCFCKPLKCHGDVLVELVEMMC
jgi:hypothetical protein